MNFCSDLRREVPVFIVDRLLMRVSINRQQLASEQIKPPATISRTPEKTFERGAIVASGNRRWS